MEFVCFVVGALCGTLLRQDRQRGNNRHLAGPGRHSRGGGSRALTPHRASGFLAGSRIFLAGMHVVTGVQLLGHGLSLQNVAHELGYESVSASGWSVDQFDNRATEP
ncbi:hypothetical protein [Ensifer adhaerens]|uniref:hypothetical protein n=1 Tax=Ensifer adhaerens TaxID=106592 RepID=UPI000AF444E9|nr:hypothetical protein [Ensifer adhaerens]